MAGDSIEIGEEDGVATIRLSRPDKLNAYTLEMGEAVTAAFRRLRDDPACRVIVLTGAGRAFCAGVDLDALKAHMRGEGPAGGPKLGEEDFLRRLPLEIAASPKPVVAAVNGAAVGVGVTMILPCDLRIAAEGATLALPFAKLRLLPGLGATHLLPRLVGRGVARELVLTGRTIDATEARAIGLVDRVVPDGELEAAVADLAHELCAIRPEVLAAAKAALEFGEAHDMAAAMENEQRAGAALRETLARTGR